MSDGRSASDPPLWRMRLPSLAHNLSATYFGCPVYLVGGAIASDDPRDIDLVIVLPDDVFVACYGNRGAWSPDETARIVSEWKSFHEGACIAEPSRLWQRWAVDCAKHALSLTMALHRRVDIKSQPATYAAAFDARPRELLAQVTS